MCAYWVKCSEIVLFSVPWPNYWPPAVSQTIKLTNRSSEMVMFVTGCKAVGTDCASLMPCLFKTARLQQYGHLFQTTDHSISTHWPLGDFKEILHDDVIKWKHFLRYWPFVWGIHRSLVNSPHKGQWRGALMFPLIFVWINSWVNSGEAGDLRGHHAHYYVIVMSCPIFKLILSIDGWGISWNCPLVVVRGLHW